MKRPPYISHHPPTTETVLKVWGLLRGSFVALVLVYLVARLPIMLFMSAFKAVAAWIQPHIISDEWSWVLVAAIMAVPFIGGFLLSAYCEVWSVAAVARLVMARSRNEPLTPRAALAHLDLMAVAKIWLWVLPLTLLGYSFDLIDTYYHPEFSVNAFYYSHYLKPYLKYLSDGVGILASCLLIVLVVAASDEKDIPAYAGRRLQTFLGVALLIGAINFGMTRLTSLLPNEAPPYVWLVVSTLERAYYILLMPVLITVATVMYLKGEGGEEETGGVAETAAEPEARD